MACRVTSLGRDLGYVWASDFQEIYNLSCEGDSMFTTRKTTQVTCRKTTNTFFLRLVYSITALLKIKAHPFSLFVVNIHIKFATNPYYPECMMCVCVCVF